VIRPAMETTQFLRSDWSRVCMTGSRVTVALGRWEFTGVSQHMSDNRVVLLAWLYEHDWID
jgi:hypothetical protein